MSNQASRSDPRGIFSLMLRMFCLNPDSIREGVESESEGRRRFKASAQSKTPRECRGVEAEDGTGPLRSRAG